VKITCTAAFWMGARFLVEIDSAARSDSCMKNFTVIFWYKAVVLGLICGFGLPGSNSAEAKSLVNRLGIGYKNQFAVDVPALAAQYYASEDTAFNAALGVQSGQNNSKFGLMVRVNHVVFPEEHMNFYLGAGAGLYNSNVTSSTLPNGGTSDSGYELQGFVGSEFFLPGLESLAFYFEAGVGIVSGSNGVIFRTFGQSPLQAGMMFYF
jgi:hypothetical protein